jgi:hypothetical protein
MKLAVTSKAIGRQWAQGLDGQDVGEVGRPRERRQALERAAAMADAVGRPEHQEDVVDGAQEEQSWVQARHGEAQRAVLDRHGHGAEQLVDFGPRDGLQAAQRADHDAMHERLRRSPSLGPRPGRARGGRVGQRAPRVRGGARRVALDA